MQTATAAARAHVDAEATRARPSPPWLHADACGRSATITAMQEELDALTAKLTELAGRVRALREENLQLRAQINAASNELEQMRSRVANAMQRIDALIERLPAETPANAQE